MRNRTGQLGMLLICAAVASAASGGCDPTPVSAIGKSGLAVQGGDGLADPADPFGACLVDHNVYGWFDCSQGATTCTGWGHGSCLQGGCTSEYHAVCDHHCEVAADCPVPVTGNVQPFCQPDFHFCELPCDDASTCPRGYVCQSTQEWGTTDANGNAIALPFICMQTITITTGPGGPDAGMP